MSSPGLITQWLNQLQQGDREAVHHLCETYFRRLVRLARTCLRNMPQSVADPEDVALSAFKSFCMAAEQKRFPKLNDRDDLWQILVMLTRNKAVNLRVYNERDKRNYHREQSQDELSAFRDLIESGEPDPQFAAEVAEQCQVLLQTLPDEECRQIAIFKMEGYTNNEIADLLGCAPATVGRRLDLIRKCWTRDAGAAEFGNEGE